MQNAKFNVIHSSEISKVLRELTQCIANDHDIFSNGNKSMPNLENTYYKENDANVLKDDNVNNIDIAKSELSSSACNSASTDLSTTQSVKSGGNKHICLQCGKQFNKRDFLQKHKIVHEIPRHKCMACDKSFVREDKLKRHFTSIHSKHRPHICDVCSKAFARKDKLKDHQKHHLTAGNSFQCTECHVPFVQKSDLNRHFRGVHKGEAGVGINIPSKRFVKSKAKDDIPKNNTNPNENQFIPNVTDSSQPGSGKPLMISSSFYPIQTSMVPLNSTSSHLAQINNISDLSKNLIKPNISFIPTLPLKVELNYIATTTLPQSVPDNKATNMIEKENCQSKFKSKRSSNKSKNKQNNHQSKPEESSTTKSGNPNKFQYGNCKTEPTTSSNCTLNCLVSQGAIYPHIPIITPFQSPMISVFPPGPEFYPRGPTTATNQTIENTTPVNSSATSNGYDHTGSLDPHASPGLRSTNHPTIGIKPAHSLGTNNIVFPHQNLYPFQQNQFRYYSYLQPGSHLFGQHSTRPLTANIYPYMLF